MQEYREETLACVLKHRLSSRETAKLVKHLLSRPRWEYAVILKSPWEVVDFKQPGKQPDFTTILKTMRRNCLQVKDTIAVGAVSETAFELVQETITAGLSAVEALKAFYFNTEKA